MSAVSAESHQSRSNRGRRTTRQAGDERERAILQTAEQLLQERSLAEVSVDDLARGAGISRPAFYFYFPSKDAVVLTLVDRMVEEAGAARDEVSERLSTDPAAAWRESLRIFYDTFGGHRAVLRAANELSPTNAEARALRSQVMEGWVAHVTERIAAERERGAAPESTPARDLATALVQMNERVLGAIFVEEAPAVAEDQVTDVLAHIWLSAIYGGPPEHPPRSQSQITVTS